MDKKSKAKITLYDSLEEKHKLPIGDYYVKVKHGIVINYWDGKAWNFPCYEYSILMPVPSYTRVQGFADEETYLQKMLKEAQQKIDYLTRTVKKQYQRIQELQK